MHRARVGGALCSALARRDRSGVDAGTALDPVSTRRGSGRTVRPSYGGARRLLRPGAWPRAKRARRRAVPGAAGRWSAASDPCSRGDPHPAPEPPNRGSVRLLDPSLRSLPREATPTPSRPICSRTVTISVRFKSSLVTATCGRRWSTRTSSIAAAAAWSALSTAWWAPVRSPRD